jgi:hypothetical protein
MGAYTLAFPGVHAHAPLASAASVPPWFYLCWQLAFPAGRFDVRRSTWQPCMTYGMPTNFMACQCTVRVAYIPEL